MRGIAALLAAATLVAACSHEADPAPPDIGNAASSAQADIDNYAASTAATTNFTPPPAPSASPRGGESQALTPENVIAEAPGDAQDNSGAAGNRSADDRR